MPNEMKWMQSRPDRPYNTEVQSCYYAQIGKKNVHKQKWSESILVYITYTYPNTQFDTRPYELQGNGLQYMKS